MPPPVAMTRLFCLPNSMATWASRALKMGFSILQKYIRDGFAGQLDDLLVQINKCAVQFLCQLLSESAFPAAGHTNQNDITKLGFQFGDDSLRFLLQIGPAGE